MSSSLLSHMPNAHFFVIGFGEQLDSILNSVFFWGHFSTQCSVLNQRISARAVTETGNPRLLDQLVYVHFRSINDGELGVGPSQVLL